MCFEQSKRRLLKNNCELKVNIRGLKSSNLIGSACVDIIETSAGGVIKKKGSKSRR